jgi:hypothetical protein
MVVTGVSTRSRQEVYPASSHASMMASGGNWVAYSILSRLSTAVMLATIPSPPVCVCDHRLRHTGDTRENHHQMKALRPRNLHLNFMPFGQEP